MERQTEMINELTTIRTDCASCQLGWFPLFAEFHRSFQMTLRTRGAGLARHHAAQMRLIIAQGYSCHDSDAHPKIIMLPASKVREPSYGLPSQSQEKNFCKK